MVAISSRAQRHQRRHRKNRVQIDSLNKTGRLNMVFLPVLVYLSRVVCPHSEGKMGSGIKTIILFTLK